MIDAIDVKGKLIHECGIDGERRSDDVYPGHPNGCQLSRDRWLLVYATRGWRNVDDDRSIIYQLRADQPDGELIREGMLRRTIDDWDPDGDGSRHVMQLGHPIVFGVPRGAVIDGRPAPQANVFVASWRRNNFGRVNPDTGLVHERVTDDVERRLRVENVQFRLNDSGDDIELLTPVELATERGYEKGSEFCSRGAFDWMNQNFTQPIPFDDLACEWISINHFSGGKVAAIKQRYNPGRGLYEWVETGPMLSTEGWEHIETSIVRSGDGWLIFTRSHCEGPVPLGANGLVATPDPFKTLSEPFFTRYRSRRTPITLYNCPDGAVRLFTGDPEVSPYRNPRNPLYCWEVDTEKFILGERHEIFDNIAEGLLPEESSPKSEMCKLLPHGGGREQVLVWRVRAMNIGLAGYHGLPAITEEMKEAHGIYHARIRYDQDLPGMWTFA
jgi:hypothetical protein